MKKYATLIGIIVICAFSGVRWLSRQAEGYAWATAETVVEGIENAIPDPIQDRKLDNEVNTVRQEIIDRQVQINLSARQIEQLETDVQGLENSVDRRKRLLAEAYPILKAAVDTQQTSVKFANQDYTLAEFQQEIDDLLSMQDRETRQVEIKSAGFVRLKKSAEEGHAALTEMKNALDQTEQEVAQLRTRRDQANVESLTLDLVSSATAQRESVGSVMTESVVRLQSNVDELEARNEARRELSGAELRFASQRIDRHWSRLESLKAIHDEAGNEASVPTTTVEASKVIITVEEATKPM